MIPLSCCSLWLGFCEAALEPVGAEAGEDAVGGSGLKMRPARMDAGLRCEFAAVVRQALESSDSPMLNAFRRVASTSSLFLLLEFSYARQRLELANLN